MRIHPHDVKQIYCRCCGAELEGMIDRIQLPDEMTLVAAYLACPNCSFRLHGDKAIEEIETALELPVVDYWHHDPGVYHQALGSRFKVDFLEHRI